MDGQKGFLFFKLTGRTTVTLMILCGAIAAPLPIRAASLKVNLELDAQYNYSSNIDAVDPSLMTPTKAQYMNLLAGGGINYRLSHVELGAKGNLGYTYYLITTGEVEKVGNIPTWRYDYFRAAASGWARYIGRILTVDLNDDLIRTRNLADVYGPQTDALSERFLYTDNIASLQLRFKLSPKTRLLLKYSYETLEFTKPENPVMYIYQPPNSIENRGYFRGEYDFNSRNTIFLDAQGGERIFLSRTIANTKESYTDYNFYQGLLGYRHRFNERSDVEVAGGAANRHFFHEQNIILMDYANPMARAAYNRSQPDKYNFSVQGEWGTSTFGQDLFFDYINAGLTFKYFFTRKLTAEVLGNYSNDLFRTVRNDRTALWKTDRVDNIYVGRATVAWDLIQKNKETVLGLRAGYEHRVRDSNLDAPSDYKIPILWTSYDTTIDYYFAEVDFLPMILIGH